MATSTGITVICRLGKWRRLLSKLTSYRYYSTPLTDPGNTGKPQRNVNFDLLGAWDNRLSLPILLEKSIKEGKPIPHIRLADVGTSTVIGRRSSNEDRIKVTWLRGKDESEVLYVGIFDGHGGRSAVDFTWGFMDGHCQHCLDQCDTIEEALKQAFINVSNSFSRHLHPHFVKLVQEDNAKGAREMLGGTTATVCIIKDSSELVIGHVGDSRAILCREGKAMRLLKVHDPENDHEKSRIKSRGGKIAYSSLGSASVNGRLAMTRSIGDVELKSSGVTAVPDINTYSIKHSRDGFLVLTTDGITNVLSDQEVVDHIGACGCPREGAVFITEEALHYGSEDNSSAVVVPFGAWGKYSSGPRNSMTGFGRNIIGKSYV